MRPRAVHIHVVEPSAPISETRRPQQHASRTMAGLLPGVSKHHSPTGQNAGHIDGPVTLRAGR